MIPVKRENAEKYRVMRRSGLLVPTERYLEYIGISDVQKTDNEFMNFAVDNRFSNGRIILEYRSERSSDEYPKTVGYISTDGEHHDVDFVSHVTVSAEQMDSLLDLYEGDWTPEKHLSIRQKKMLFWLIVTGLLSSVGLHFYARYLSKLYMIWSADWSDIITIMPVDAKYVSTSEMILHTIGFIILFLFWCLILFVFIYNFKPYKKCPKCHSNADVYRMEYGLDITESLPNAEKIMNERKGERVWSGGCGNTGFKWYCDYCEEEFK